MGSSMAVRTLNESKNIPFNDARFVNISFDTPATKIGIVMVQKVHCIICKENLVDQWLIMISKFVMPIRLDNR